MTPVQDMPDQQLNRKLAEILGYRIEKWRLGYVLIDAAGFLIANEVSSEELAWSTLNFCADPIVASKVQAKAIQVNRVLYLDNLLRLVSPGNDIQFGLGGSMEVVGYNIDGTTAMLLATPRQIAEAAYITLRWETLKEVKQ